VGEEEDVSEGRPHHSYRIMIMNAPSARGEKEEKAEIRVQMPFLTASADDPGAHQVRLVGHQYDGFADDVGFAVSRERKKRG